jgi:hypothetical protein
MSHYVIRDLKNFRKLMILLPNDGKRVVPPPGLLHYVTDQPHTIFLTKADAMRAVRAAVKWRKETDGGASYEIQSMLQFTTEQEESRRVAQHKAKRRT